MFLRILLFSPLVLLTSCVSTQRVQLIGEEAFKVEVTKYLASKPRKKSVIIMPPTGGSNFLDRRYASALQSSGFDVYIVEKWSDYDENSSDLELHQRLYSRAEKAISLVLKEITTPYIGMLGTSVGALHTAVAVNTQDRIDSAFVIVGGVPQMDVVVHSDQKAMRELKEKRYKRYGFKKDEEYLAALNKNFHLEPTKLGDKFKTKILGMVIASEDTTVPTKNQNQLKEFWQPRSVTTLNGSHFWIIVKAWLWHSNTIVDFFKQEP